MNDLPWAPAKGQTALRVIDRNADFVLCEDKGNPAFRSLWRPDGALVCPGGARLVLPQPSAAIDTSERAVLLLIDTQKRATLVEIADYAAVRPDKALVRLLALAERGLISADASTPRQWRLTKDGEAALRAGTPEPPRASAPAAVVKDPAAVTPPAPMSSTPVQMSLF